MWLSLVCIFAKFALSFGSNMNDTKSLCGKVISLYYN